MIVYKFCFYVFEEYVEVVKNVVFEVGVGCIGNYDCCSFQVVGQGQFWFLEGSDFYIGGQGEIEMVCEFWVEIICMEDYLCVVISVLCFVYFYEEFVIDLWKFEDLLGQGVDQGLLL